MTRSEYFSPAELRCKCDDPNCPRLMFNPEFLKKLNRMREIYYQLPLAVTSGYRCAKHDKAVGGSGKNHPLGLAIDVLASKGADLMDIILAAHAVGIRRVVVYHNKPHVHIDDNPDLPRGLFVL